MVALIAGQPGRVGLHHPPEAVRRHPPVVVGIAVDPEVQRGRDDEQAPRLEHPVHLVEGPADLEDVLERLDAEHRPGHPVGQAHGADVLDAVDPRTRPHVAADERSSREHRPKVGVVELALDLVRTELIDRAGTREGLGHESTEGFRVVSHRGPSSMNAQARHSPPSWWSQSPTGAWTSSGETLGNTPRSVNPNQNRGGSPSSVRPTPSWRKVRIRGSTLDFADGSAE